VKLGCWNPLARLHLLWDKVGGFNRPLKVALRQLTPLLKVELQLLIPTWIWKWSDDQAEFATELC